MSTGSKPRFPALDGLRAVAALSVLVFHAGAYSLFNSRHEVGHLTARGDVGVTIFFLLSGFLLYRPFVAARLQGEPAPAIGRFYWRRIVRIVPAYWLALTVLSIWPGLGGDPLSIHGWRYYLFLQNLSLETVQAGIGPAWTLCVELSFYLLLPLYALAAGRWLRSLRAELIALAVIFVASFAYRWLAADSDSRVLLTTLFTLPVFGTWFAAGMAVATLSAHGRLRVARPELWWAAALIVFAVCAFGVGLPRVAFQAPTVSEALVEHLLYALVATLLLVPAVAAGEHPGGVVGVLRLRVVAWFGLVSYGIYLWHLPLVTELAPGGMVKLLGIGGGLAIAAATLSYYLLERPLLRLTSPRRRGPSTD